MKPPIAYYGGKSRLAPWIVSLMPKHRVYVEPFAGSAAVLFAKRRSTHEILNDIDGDLVCFFRVLRDQPEDLEHAVRLTPYSREEYLACQEASGGGADDNDLERARRWWVQSTQAFDRAAHSFGGWSISIQRGSSDARSTWNRIARFAAAAERLGTVTIENRGALEVIQRYATSDSVIYADPPYLGSTRTSFAEGRRPNGDYRHELHSDDDHRALAEVLRSAPGTVLLSGYPSGLYEELYSDWHRVDRRVPRNSSNRRSKHPSWATEVIWSNRPMAIRSLFDAVLEQSVNADQDALVRVEREESPQ